MKISTFLHTQKKEFNKVKHDLEVYRELLLVLHGVLKWEQQWYPGVIGGVITFLWLLIWILDFSTLTLVAVVALLVTVIDYGYPLVSKFIFKPEQWSGAQEKLYEEVIESIVNVKLCLKKTVSSFFSSRSERSTFVSGTIVVGLGQIIDSCLSSAKFSSYHTQYLISVTIGSLILAWIGSTFNNLFLLYLVALVSAMYPGLKEKGIVKLVFDKVDAVAGPYLKKFRAEKSEKSD